MIQNIKLKGFQSHIETNISFSPGVNILIGPSRNGKTSILRAFRWLSENRPIGIDGFITHGQKEISVTLTIDNHTITRRKNGKENVYILDGETFAGMGSSVPPQITQLLNLSDLNISNQFDQPYLLFDSPGQVAQKLNTIVNLEDIDKALANISSMKRANDQDIRVQDIRVTELETLEASFPDLDAAEEFITELEKQKKDYDLAIQRKGILESIKVNLEGCRYNLIITQVPEGIENQVLSLSNKQVHKDQLSYTKDALLGIQTKLSQARLEISRIEPALGQEHQVIGLMAKNQSWKRKMETLIKLNMYQNNLDLAQINLTAKITIIEQEEKKFLEEFPSICPLCERPI